MNGPLTGVRVVELTHFLAGPYAGLALADLGADVVKLEDPDRPDEARSMGPFFQGGLSMYFAALNWGKRSIGVRLGTERGQELARDVIRGADVLLDNYRPGVLTKVGLGHATLRRLNPRLVTCSLTGYGETGPDALRPGYDYTIQAMSGVMSMGGEPTGPPAKAGISYVDHSGGLAAALAVCAALVERYRSGLGRHVDIGLLDVQVSMLSYLASWSLNCDYEPERTARSGHPALVPAQNFPTSDGWISLFVGNDWMWQRLIAVLGDDRLSAPRYADRSGRLEHRDEVVAILDEVFGAAPATTWAARLSDAGVACAPVNDLGAGLDERQVAARDLITSSQTRSGYHYRHTRGPIPAMGGHNTGGAPGLGEHTRAVLLGSGIAPTVVDELEAEGIVSPSTV